ncbi:hypothetical protein GTQ99_08470 [Kineococcus sp. T13]|uniref:hypothetical protein n=1 Tax=Kineococcus vitellinus TaxID=2696565 RepID=UPI001412CE61|nr:hypothetical protein [Kineococcus vitellinus]NAZ75455.1 hypothetical protein [Kineococcus vitellinus]
MTVVVDDSRWAGLPGVFELLERGVGADEAVEAGVFLPQVRGGHVDAARLQRLWDWLRGFQLQSVLCERLPIWVPVVSVWVPEGASAELTYSRGTGRERNAEITVFAVAGFGGASRRELTREIQVEIHPGLRYETRAYLTVRRYANHFDEQVDRVEVDCSGEVGEFQYVDLPLAQHPFSGGVADLDDLTRAGWALSSIERSANRTDPVTVTHSSTSVRSWKVGLTQEIPGLSAPIKLGVSAQATDAFQTAYTLPGGRDYAFCAPSGELPIAPVCVSVGSPRA